MIAEAKLLFKTQSASPGKLSSPQCFAILGSIIQTRVSLHAPINSELVASHAAHCVYIDAKRKMIVSDYPPQFVYASAANRVLASDDKRCIECIDALADAVKKGLVASGDAGEMATRLILIRAMQKTKPIAHEDHRFDPNGHSVQLVDFLRTLSGKDPRDMKFDCIETADRDNLLTTGGSFSITLPGSHTHPALLTSWSFCTEVLRSNARVGKLDLTSFSHLSRTPIHISTFEARSKQNHLLWCSN
ncbi:hypothetical protein PSTT_10604 [Puccinia striiformis]|uniref:Uncharacterized protein n=1 Tax=Puccinia striiformis TaxID=27350 RepID=A0A2S4V3U6_9BASI|nr:hypothetical protein PSTT_10604 [Puccinia striiformis]